MKFRNFAFNSAIFITALFFGLAWVGAFQFFTGKNNNNAMTCSFGGLKSEKKLNFDINDSNSVLPLDFEEDKLTLPKVDENNTAYFDPEGSYYLLDEAPEGFEDFKQFNIFNKRLDVDPRDRSYGELVKPAGYVFLSNEKKHSTYTFFKKLDIEDDKIYFEALSVKGISYEFSGEFAVKGNFYTLDQDAEVVEGILTKKENGETVAESRVNFGWELNN